MRFERHLALFAAALSSVAVACASADGTGPGENCVGPVLYTVGVGVDGSISDTDCTGPDKERLDVYQISLTGQTNFMLKMTSSGFTGGMGMFTSVTSRLSEPEIFGVDGSGTIGGRVFLPAGTYYLAVGSESGRGNYVLESSLAASNDCSVENWTAAGMSINGVLTSTDCAGNPGVHQDIYFLRMVSGRSYTVTATLQKPGNLLLRPAGASNTDLRSQGTASASGGTLTFSYTPTTTGDYRVHVLSDFPSGPVGYTLKIE